MDVWADLIRVRVEMGPHKEPQAANAKGGGSKVREVWTLGNVEVRQEHQPGEKPLRITGDKMHLVNRTETDQVVHVYGKPGHVYDRLTHIQADRIHLDRGRNVSWVDGKGLLQLPVDRTLEGRKLAKPQILDVWWRKSMNFDGTIARFRGQVRTVVDDSRIRCEEMDVYLTERVSFIKRTGRDTSPQKTQPAKVKSVDCRGNVQFESYEYDAAKTEKDRLMQIRKGNVKSFTVDQATGNTRATGPGTIEIWRYGQGSSTPFGKQASVRSNKATKKTKTPAWNYTKITFSEATTGNTKQRHNRFRTHVEVVYGPVQRPPHVVDPDNLPKGNSGWLRGRDLVVTQQAAAKGRAAYLTLEMDGNAEVDGAGFHGRADTITYDESQGLYTLRSLGRRNATIWRQLKRGGETDRADAKRMQFIPATNSLKLDQTATLQGLR